MTNPQNLLNEIENKAKAQIYTIIKNYCADVDRLYKKTKKLSMERSTNKNIRELQEIYFNVKQFLKNEDNICELEMNFLDYVNSLRKHFYNPHYFEKYLSAAENIRKNIYKRWKAFNKLLTLEADLVLILNCANSIKKQKI